jgi:HAE1 family hydrophobic/amphiphilic exporter-1
MSLASAALKRPVTTVAATLALVLLGAVSLSRLPVSLLPDITLPVLTVRTVYPGAAATEASRLVAEPIEQAVASTPGLVELRSVSRNAEVTTTLRFAWGTSMAETVLLVRERLDNARAQLPERAERPTLLTSDPGERPIAVLALSGPGDLQSISRTAEDVHARRLEQLAGVASVAVAGKPEEEIRVEVDPDKARALGISPDQIATAVRDAMPVRRAERFDGASSGCRSGPTPSFASRNRSWRHPSGRPGRASGSAIWRGCNAPSPIR